MTSITPLSTRPRLGLLLAILMAIPAGARAQDAPVSAPWENLRLFGGLDGSKQPQDLGINANMGVRLSANLGFPILRERSLGGQIGVAANFSDAAVHVLDQIEGTSRRSQVFVTLGVSQRAGQKVGWGLAYDLLLEKYYDDFTLGQVRGFAGYDLTNTAEVGVRFAKSIVDADGFMGDTPVHLEPISQVTGYFARTWPTLARTTVWAGVAGDHGNVVWVLPENSRSRNVLVYGAELDLPLSDRFAVSGSANFLTPTATGTVDAFLGFTYYPGRNAQTRTRGTFGPRQAVANNPTFSVNMLR